MEALRRKIEINSSMPAVPAARDVAAAFALALGRAIRMGIGLDAACLRVRALDASLVEITDLLPERALLASLEGPESGMGLVALGPDLLAGILEKQAYGRLTTRNSLPRRPTRTDAAMVSGLIDRSLMELANELAAEPDFTWIDGFRFSAHLEDARLPLLLLEDISYRLITAEVVLGGGEKKGLILFALPSIGKGRNPEAAPQQIVDSAHYKAARFKQALRSRIEGADAQLSAIIARLQMPLHRALNLSPGSLLTLPQAALDQISLETSDGRRLMRCKLGQSRGMRAIRLLKEQAEGHDDGSEAGQAQIFGAMTDSATFSAEASPLEPETELATWSFELGHAEANSDAERFSTAFAVEEHTESSDHGPIAQPA